MRADIDDGQEHQRSAQGPDTEAQDQLSPDHQIPLATHGRHSPSFLAPGRQYSLLRELPRDVPKSPLYILVAARMPSAGLHNHQTLSSRVSRAG